MEGILHIPYINTDFDDNNFNYSGNIDYITQLNNASKNIVGFNGFNEYIQNTNKLDNSININNLNKKIEVLDEQLSYYDLQVSLYDTDNSPINIDYLLNLYNTADSFMLSFSFDPDFSDEDCLVELKSWLSESKKVMDLPDNEYSEELKMEMLPKRTFKFSTEKSNSYLENCIFFDCYDNKIVIFVEKIIFYNK